jgi:hypothetical protein
MAPDPLDDRVAHLVDRSGDSGLPWFDRFYFNLQSPDGETLMILGGACYPGVRVEDGYACVGRAHEQLSVRFAQAWHGGAASAAIGPLEYEVAEPLTEWHLALSDPSLPLRCDLTATARTSACRVDTVAVNQGDATLSSHEHFFQSIQYAGSVTIDGVETVVDGWLGHRDRSWGVRRTRERLGFHLWGAVHLPNGSIGVLYNEARDHSPIHCDGAFMGTDGSLTRIIDVLHDVEVADARAGISAGTITFVLEDGSELVCTPRALRAAVDLAGAGYDGRHGTPAGGRELEVERWDLTDPLWDAHLSMRVVGRIYETQVNGVTAPAVLETSVTRSASYRYEPRRRPSNP